VASAAEPVLYVHAADDGGILVVDGESGRSAWVTADELSRRLDELSAAGGSVLLSTSTREGPRTPIGSATVEQVNAVGLAVLKAKEVHPDAVRPGGATTLMFAAHVDARDLLADLVGRGVDVEQRDASGYTALMYAANAGESGACELLLAAGSDPNAADAQGSTPLMFAAQHGHLGVARCLLCAGALVGARGDHGMSAYDFAVQNDHRRVAALLLSAEQNVL
jgi:ankyrin repeat protein